MAYDRLGQFTGVSPASPQEVISATAATPPGIYVGPERDISVIVRVHAIGGTSPTLDIKFQDSPDNSSFADMNPSGAVAQINAADVEGAEPRRIGLHIKKLRPYVRMPRTLGGTGGPSVTLSAVIASDMGQPVP